MENIIKAGEVSVITKVNTLQMVQIYTQSDQEFSLLNNAAKDITNSSSMTLFFLDTLQNVALLLTYLFFR